MKYLPREEMSDLCGKYSSSNMSNARLNGDPEVNRLLIDEFKDQEGVKNV